MEDLKDKTPLLEFMNKHCQRSPYAFQIKKCSDDTCSYCKAHPIHVTPEQFTSLHYLPLPLLDTSKANYQPFEKLYGTEPLVKDQPSSKPSSNEEAVEADRSHKPILKNTKVRKVITCGDCCKPRCIYSATRLTREQEVFVQLVVESGVYTCGSVIFHPNSPYHNAIVVRQNCSCTDPMEASYYSSALVKFPSVCFYCGMGKDSLIDDVELKRKFGIVRPLCSVRKGQGRTHKVSHPNNVTNKKRRIVIYI